MAMTNPVEARTQQELLDCAWPSAYLYTFKRCAVIPVKHFKLDYKTIPWLTVDVLPSLLPMLFMTVKM